LALLLSVSTCTTSEKPGYSVAQGGEFAYLQLDKIEAADVAFDATPAHAATLLSMQKAAVAPVNIAQAAIKNIATGNDWLMVYVFDSRCAVASPRAQQEHRDLETARRLEALREAVNVGIADFDAGNFQSFDTPAALSAHLAALTDEALSEHCMWRARAEREGILLCSGPTVLRVRT